MNYDYDTTSLPHCLQWQKHANNSLNNNEKKDYEEANANESRQREGKNHIIRKYEWEYAMGFKVLFFFPLFFSRRTFSCVLSLHLLHPNGSLTVSGTCGNY
jgi:hypothetical protein